jgi:acyl carrier protein
MLSMDAQNATQGTASGEDEALVAVLRRYLAELSEGKLGFDEIDPSAHLFDYGYIDSLSAVMFTAHLEEQYGVRIEEVELLERFTSLQAIAAHLEQERR